MIELLVVLAALAVLLSLAAPRYVEHVDRARETVLKQNLAGLRDAIDKFRADRDRFPVDLQELVRERYLRTLPVDPFTDRADSWITRLPPAGELGGVADVYSSASGDGRNGVPYASW